MRRPKVLAKLFLVYSLYGVQYVLMFPSASHFRISILFNQIKDSPHGVAGGINFLID